MKLRNRRAWKEWKKNNTDPYGKACIDYAENWANLMEKRMKGTFNGGIAKQASYDADSEGITGFMYGAAVKMLAVCWKWGEELRQWHNLDIQIQHEGELANEEGTVLNPALINIQFPNE